MSLKVAARCSNGGEKGTNSNLINLVIVEEDWKTKCFLELHNLCVLPPLQVTVVGVIRGVSPFATYILYSVDDMTGPPLKVKLWMNSEVGSTDSSSTHCSASFHRFCSIYFVSLVFICFDFSSRIASFHCRPPVLTSRSWGVCVISE